MQFYHFFFVLSSLFFSGRTHDSTYTLYRLGERLSTGARLYVETGRADGLDAGGESQNTLHSFTGPPIPQGEGTSIARAFLDGNHTLISIMARINPSPDWFVGVDSFQLCVEGNWVDTVTVELDPLDGGTDNGFTFTAANWPTQPQGIAYRITSRYPAHPAGSFYYPNLPRLPPIATLTFTKVIRASYE
ncbi:Spondin-2 [Vespula squamosa]|uniref:Spondin-2 n=1 Tax=Vespula squamosa TaxID=30214 RepID=A0ABD2A820_VESSQ